MPEARMISAESRVLSPWVTLMTRVVDRPGAGPQAYHSLAQADYVSVLAVTPDGQVPLVRQFRPAVGRVTLELPGGLLEPGEDPARTAARELEEEVGMRSRGAPTLLGTLLPDTGRLENRFWCFYAGIEPMGAWQPEPGLERVLLTRSQLREAVLGGSFDHALHLALIGLASMRGEFRWED